jgi:hypothetical protein
MAYYKTCPFCGAHLDPGEACECFEARFDRLTPENKKIVEMEIIRLREQEQKEAALGAGNTGDGKAEQSTTAVSASIVNENEEDCKR